MENITVVIFPRLVYTGQKEPLELIHSDVCGKMSIPSLSGALYFVTFIDDTLDIPGFMSSNVRVKCSVFSKSGKHLSKSHQGTE